MRSFCLIISQARQHGRWLALLVALPVLAVAAIWLWPMDTAPYLGAERSAELLDRSGRPLYTFLNSREQWRFPQTLEDISPYLIKATIAAEDQRFHRHPGVDPVALARALWQNVRGRHIVSGASTVTMQVVKWPSGNTRSLCGKAIQMAQALRLERRVTKDDILAAYLNGAPYGLNLVGCEAASRRYFGKRARELTLAEAALLAGLPKAPMKLAPIQHPNEARERRDYVLARMLAEGIISEADCQRAVAEPVAAAWHDFPALAPHLAMRMKNSLTRGGPIRTTIDADIQQRAEQLAKEGVAEFGGPITNAAIIVADVSSGDILARVGSSNFWNTPGGGQVDACRAPRSPGSALKPFIYAVAMEHNCLYPSESLLDNTLDYGLYQPVNYDGQFHGIVTASEALRRSLNIPAVTVLGRVGVSAVHDFLQRAGLSTLRHSADYYGLGLTLGNCEVTLEEASGAYVMLAALGIQRPSGDRLLSRGTCLAIYSMLEQPLPAEFARDLVPAGNAAPRVCWKTGTSTGLHDAWAFVFNAQYVVGVWMGNNTAQASRSLVGVRAALPLASRVFRSLPAGSAPSWPDMSGDLRDVSICAVSGLPISPWCRQTRVVQFPAEQYLNRVCDMHYPADRRTDAATPLSAQNAPIVERWPTSAKKWDLARIDTGPSVRPEGDASTAADAAKRRTDAFRILSPADHAEFVLTGERRGDRIQLSASLDAHAALHWYVDDCYIEIAEPERPLYLDLQAGKHKLACLAPDGQTDTVAIKVVAPARRGPQ